MTHSNNTTYKTIQIDGLDIFYRQAGSPNAPTILLLHGFPTSSHMFRNLIPKLADHFHLIAPDYPGFGASAMPQLDTFEYTFDSFANIIEKLTIKLDLQQYFLYLMDYGAPVGYRLATKYPNKVLGLIIQNGNAYEEGLQDFWQPIKAYWQDKTPQNAQFLADNFLTLQATKWQYTNGVRNPQAIAPDNWFHDQYLLDRPGNKEIQLQLFYDYSTNLSLYPKWQQYFRQFQPPAIILWGKGDYIFPEQGAYPYKRDLNNLKFHILDTGHFALEEDLDLIANQIRSFASSNTST